uniref:Uncharacterized protein n=1 Tax=Arundo donax TaxID=35708 RepID=A0A0A9BLH0_ARUDO
MILFLVLSLISFYVIVLLIFNFCSYIVLKTNHLIFSFEIFH